MVLADPLLSNLVANPQSELEATTASGHPQATYCDLDLGSEQCDELDLSLEADSEFV